MEHPHQEDFAPQKARNALEERYKRDGTLTGKKLSEYFPTMLVNNLSVLLLVTVDGLVVGNLVGKNALAAVNIFYPATTLIGVASSLVGSGTGTSIAVAVGKGDYDALRRLKSASKRIIVTGALIMSVVQIPLVAGIIASYGLDDNMAQLTWQYAIGIMIATPFGLVSTMDTSNGYSTTAKKSSSSSAFWRFPCPPKMRCKSRAISGRSPTRKASRRACRTALRCAWRRWWATPSQRTSARTSPCR